MLLTTSAARARPTRRGRLAVAGLAAWVGCGDHGAAPSPAGSSPTRSAPLSPIDRPPGDPLPASGEVRLHIDDGKISLRTNAASRRSLLERLSRELSFELVAPDLGNEPITLRAESAPLRDILPRLLPDRPYRVDYRFDPVTARHELARLEVGARGALEVPRPRAAEALPGGATARSAQADPPKAASRASEQPRPGRDFRALLRQLDDSDAEERIAAIERIEPEGEGVGVLIERLANDPSPRVRGAAAQRLEDSDTLVAIDALIRALSDPDKQVVLDAIDALEFSDDESVVDDLAPLTRHPDREIAEAAREAQCFIRWDCD